MINRSQNLKVAKRNRVKRKFKGIHDLTKKASVCVFRSNKNIYASFINETGQCLHTVFIKNSGNIEAAKSVGVKISEWIKANKKDSEPIVFNRNGFRYHGRVKALADGMRESGIAI